MTAFVTPVTYPLPTRGGTGSSSPAAGMLQVREPTSLSAPVPLPVSRQSRNSMMVAISRSSRTPSPIGRTARLAAGAPPLGAGSVIVAQSPASLMVPVASAGSQGGGASPTMEQTLSAPCPSFHDPSPQAAVLRWQMDAAKEGYEQPVSSVSSQLKAQLKASEKKREEQEQLIKKQAQDIADLKQLYELTRNQLDQEVRACTELRAIIENQQQELRNMRRQPSSPSSSRLGGHQQMNGNAATPASAAGIDGKETPIAGESKGRTPSGAPPTPGPPTPAPNGERRAPAPEARRPPSQQAHSSRETAKVEDSVELCRPTSNSNLALLDEWPVGLNIPDPATGEGDRIDKCIRTYYRQYPDFKVGVRKERTGWYSFGRPIAKRVFMKVVGSHVVVRCGGGYTECDRWLEEYRLEMLEGEQILEGMEKVRRASSNRGGRRPSARSHSPLSRRGR